MQRLELPLRVRVWQTPDRVLHFCVANPNTGPLSIDFTAQRTSEVESRATVGPTGALGFEASAIYSWQITAIDATGRRFGLWVGSLRFRLPIENANAPDAFGPIAEVLSEPAIGLPLHYVPAPRVLH